MWRMHKCHEADPVSRPRMERQTASHQNLNRSLPVKLSNTTILVTGANRGIGLALVQALLDAGASRIYAAARHPDQLAKAVAADPARVVPVQLDVTDAASVDSAARTIGTVDVLINNAGAAYFGNLLDMPMEQVTRDLDVNYLGTRRVVRAFAPLFQQSRGGAVVNLLSVVSLASAPSLGGYLSSPGCLSTRLTNNSGFSLRHFCSA